MSKPETITIDDVKYVRADAVKEQGIDSALIISAYVPKKLKLYDKYIKTKYLIFL